MRGFEQITSFAGKTILLGMLCLTPLIRGVSPEEVAHAQGELPGFCREIEEEQQGLDVVLMIDDSNSMNETFDPTPWNARDRLRFRSADFVVEYLLADSLSRGVEHNITVWSFGNTVTPLVEWERIDADAQDGRTFKDIKADIQPTTGLTGTDFGAVLEQAFDLLRGRPEYGNQPVILIISDLMPNNFRPEQEVQVRESIQDTLGIWERLTAELMPVPIYMLALDERVGADPRYPFDEAWNEFFFEPLRSGGGQGAVLEFNEGNNVVQFEKEILEQIVVRPWHNDTVESPEEIIKIVPYLQEVIFAFMRSNPGIEVSVPTPVPVDGRDRAASIVHGEYLSVFTVNRPVHTEWMICASDVRVRALVGQVKPHLEVVVGQPMVVVGQSVVFTAQLPPIVRHEPGVEVWAEWADNDNPHSWKSLGLGDEIHNGREWELSTSPDEELNYVVRFSAKDAQSGVEITPQVECEVVAVKIPRIAHIEPVELTAGDSVALTVTIVDAHKMSDVQLAASFVQLDGNNCGELDQVSSVEKPTGRYSHGRIFSFKQQVLPSDNHCFLQLGLSGATTDGILIDEHLSWPIKLPLPEPVPRPTLEPETVEIETLVPEPYVPSMAIKALILSSLIFVASSALIILIKPKGV